MARNKNAAGVSMRINSERKALPSHDNIAVEQLSDEVLAAQVARGEGRALETLYDRYASIVLGISLKIVGDRDAAEDVLQETFWRVWRSARSYQSQRGSFAGWLFRIARNLAIDAYRRRSVRPQATPSMDEREPVLDQVSDPNVDVAEQVLANIQNREVRVA